MEHVFGPVPSRRLGLSLGVNNIPPKHCTYSCVYCQIGRTTKLEVNRRAFYDPSAVVKAVVEVAKRTNPDVITFVPDGEPTLDLNLGEEIEKIKKSVRIPVAVLTNASLISRPDVMDDLLKADIVSVKVDALTESIWRKINRPHPLLKLSNILKGIEEFSSSFKGRLICETMLVKGINEGEAGKIAEFLGGIKLDRAYIGVPIRPPAEPWAVPPEENDVISAYNKFSEVLGEEKVELLIGYEGPGFELEGDPRKYLEAVAAVHPIRIDYAEEFLKNKGHDPNEILGELLRDEILVSIEYRGVKFLIKKFR
ncbi:MAG: radical SAM protein [Candidatus Methanodesulfokora sp.]|jgi:wyosine [tRNA(Phe)-imidazoG37] synthetase (radical SAM superfamily)